VDGGNTTSGGWNKQQIEALQARFDQNTSPVTSEAGMIPNNSWQPTYPVDPPYNPSIAGPEISTGSTYLCGDQNVSTPFIAQQATDLPPPPAYPATGYNSGHYTTLVNTSIPASIHGKLPYSISPYIQPDPGTNEQSVAPSAPSLVSKY